MTPHPNPLPLRERAGAQRRVRSQVRKPRHRLGQIRERDGDDDPGLAQRGRHIDARHAGMRDRAAQDRRVQHASHLHVIDKPARASEQIGILEPGPGFAHAGALAGLPGSAPRQSNTARSRWRSP